MCLTATELKASNTTAIGGKLNPVVCDIHIKINRLATRKNCDVRRVKKITCSILKSDDINYEF